MFKTKKFIEPFRYIQLQNTFPSFKKPFIYNVAGSIPGDVIGIFH